jgi:hypothetical protein
VLALGVSQDLSRLRSIGVTNEFRATGGRSQLIAILVLLTCGIDAPLNNKVVEFARSKLGQQVGDGECSSLAAAALRNAGARVRRGNHGTWGDELKSLRDAQSGDIVQFENAVFISTQFLDDGGVITQTLEFPHHTAVIAQVRKRRKKPVLVILHQNVGGSKIVQEWTIDLAQMRRGSMKIYRPASD